MNESTQLPTVDVLGYDESIVISALHSLFDSKLSKEEESNLLDLFHHQQMRDAFTRELNLLRAKPPGMEIPKSAFFQLCKLVEAALVHAEDQEDFTSFKRLIHLSSTFYRCVSHKEEEPFHDYITSYIAHSKRITIWQSKKFWSEIYYDAVLEEKEKSTSRTEYKWKDTDNGQKVDIITQEKNIYFAMLGTFSHMMTTFGVTPVETRLFIRKQCNINGLSPEQTEMLMDNLDNVVHSIEVSEKKREKILFLTEGSITSNTPNKMQVCDSNTKKGKSGKRGKKIARAVSVRGPMQKIRVYKEGRRMEARLRKELDNVMLEEESDINNTLKKDDSLNHYHRDWKKKVKGKDKPKVPTYTLQTEWEFQPEEQKTKTTVECRISRALSVSSPEPIDQWELKKKKKDTYTRGRRKACDIGAVEETTLSQILRPHLLTSGNHRTSDDQSLTRVVYSEEEDTDVWDI